MKALIGRVRIPVVTPVALLVRGCARCRRSLAQREEACWVVEAEHLGTSHPPLCVGEPRHLACSCCDPLSHPSLPPLPTAAGAALQSIVEAAINDAGAKEEIFGGFWCIHCMSVDPPDWIKSRKGKKAP